MALPYVLARRALRFSRWASPALLVANVLLGALVFVQGCLSAAAGDVRHVMLGIACLVAGLTVVTAEFVHVAVLRMYAAFLFSFCGRGLLYVVLGCLTVDTAAAELGVGVALAAAGATFLALALVPRLPFDDPADRYAAAIRGPQAGAVADTLPTSAGGASAPKSVLAMGISAPLGASSSTFDVSRSGLVFQSPLDGYAAADRGPRV
ncbi:hypothetical protein LPJ61_000736 [Coemansia biformis]|uniref:COPI associated n=1 Tax=Coemansia biformis TaxID=1286918 RepID=A0A9W7YI49_9FUNG|nr:hypothetical protein LPJ61_000736 [Coemansia biformis]